MKHYIVFLSLVAATRVPAQSYTIDWYKIAGGGGTSSSAVTTSNGTNSLSVVNPLGNLYFRLTGP